MGEVIRKDAARDDVMSDVGQTMTNAKLRGGDWAVPAQEKLGPFIELYTGVKVQYEEAVRVAAPLIAAVQVADARADDVVHGVRDDLFNFLGRPGSDPYLSTLFPEGGSTYADAALESQPDLMDLLAELLEGGIHPRIDKERAQKAAASLRAAATPLREAHEAASKPRAKVRLRERMLVAIAKSAQIQLASLKRRYKSDGKSEAEIHQVIPDRPTAKAKKEELQPTG